MIVFSVVGMVWVGIALLFIWMVIHYGLSQGKGNDVAKEFQAKENDRQERADERARAREISGDLEQDLNRSKNEQDRKAS